ncbi:MAG: DUF4350 domain-containing protein [Acidobacteriota bacterium]
MNRRIVAIVVLLVLGALGLAVAKMLFEPVERSVERGYQGEAAINPYLAFQETLRALGVPTRSVTSLPRLPKTDHVLVMAAPQRGSGPAGSERLVEWARSGGHLVVLPIEVADTDPLLDELDVMLFDQDESDDDDHLSTPEFSSDRPPWPLLHHHGSHQIVRSEGAVDASWMLSMQVGSGTVTVLSDGAFLHNDTLADKDHALIGWTAVSLDGEPPAGVWIVFRDPPPSLASLLGDRQRPAVVSLLALIVVGLLVLARRRGPLLDPAERERRQFAEHLRATGSFLWSVGAEDRLLDATRQALRRRLAHGHVRGAEASLQDLLPPSSVGPDDLLWNDAMTLRDCRDPKRFTRIIRYLETSRRSP